MPGSSPPHSVASALLFRAGPITNELLEGLEPLVDRQDPAGGHWYWLGAFARTREALFFHAPTDALPRSYAVVSVLMQASKPLPPLCSVFNKCGVVACVNPAHWHVETAHERGLKNRPVVLIDFDGKGWASANRTTTCSICFQPPTKPCATALHDADFRRRLSADRTPCSVCGALPYQDCDSDVHYAAFLRDKTDS